jgi:DNA-binding CsgD family transcriptional regulator
VEEQWKIHGKPTESPPLHTPCMARMTKENIHEPHKSAEIVMHMTPVHVASTRALLAPFDSLAARLRFASGQNPHTEAVAALANSWFAVIRECFNEARNEAARAGLLCLRYQLHDLEPLAGAISAMVEAFDGRRGVSTEDLDGLTRQLTFPHLEPADQSAALWLECVLEIPNWFTFSDRYDDATISTERLLEAARLTRDLGTEVQALGCRIELDLRRGRWIQCRNMLSHAFALSHELGSPTGYLDVLAARLAAGRGDSPNVERHVGSARTYAYDRGDSSTLWRANAVGAFAAISNGDPELAESLLRPLASGQCLSGGHLAAVRLWDGDYVEALVSTGKVSEARHIVDLLKSPFPSPWAAAIESRCRALVDDGGEGFAQAMNSVEGFARIGAVFEQARSELVAGELAQRLGSTNTARGLLRQAHATFEALGAIPWADRAGRTLRTGNHQSHSPMGRLTTQEREIVSALSKGSSNREISQQLFISIKTVESHLTHTYQKFGVASRTQLIAKLFQLTP